VAVTRVVVCGIAGQLPLAGVALHYLQYCLGLRDLGVKARTGAFNDRSLNYLASGRPVVCSDTGLDWLPTGAGLLPFDDAAGAATALAAVEADPAAHAAAARRLAEEHFAAADVLCELLAAAGVPVPALP
jgi:glycosyltransferase involved in cell wall biosynthesis